MTTQEKNTVASLIRQEYSRLLRYIRYRIEDRADMDAEDIIQEVALSLYTRVDFQEPIENLAGYIYRAIKNKIIDIQRKRKTGSLNLQKDESKLLKDAEMRIESRAEEEELIYQAMYKVLEEMEPESRNLIVATELEGISFREISQQTGIPVGTLLSRKHRALAIMQKKMKEQYPGIRELYYNQ